MAKKKQKLDKKPLLFMYISIVIIASLMLGLFFMLMKSDYFKIKEVVYFGVDDSTSLVKYLDTHNKNLFDLNLKQIENNIMKKHKEFESVKIKRVLPDKIYVHIDMRQPVARVEYKSDFIFIDSVGREVSKTDFFNQEGLPKVIGMNPKLTGKGSAEAEKLKVVLSLIKALNDYKNLGPFKVTAIDVSTAKNTAILLNDSLMVKIGEEDFSNRLQILSALLKQVTLETGKIKYIDLRFNEPVIAKK